MTQRKMHYEILKVGSEPNKRFLQKTMSGVLWTSQGYSQKFLDLGEAVKEQRKHENSYIIWVDESKDAKEFYGSWGEVNRDYIARTF
jgi:hypothetical protein